MTLEVSLGCTWSACAHFDDVPINALPSITGAVFPLWPKYHAVVAAQVLLLSTAGVGTNADVEAQRIGEQAHVEAKITGPQTHDVPIVIGLITHVLPQVTGELTHDVPQTIGEQTFVLPVITGEQTEIGRASCRERVYVTV